MAKSEAAQATVEGQDQGVGFRALVMKQAIAYNLVGSAVNEPNLVARFTLQGNEKSLRPSPSFAQAPTNHPASPSRRRLSRLILHCAHLPSSIGRRSEGISQTNTTSSSS
jgi:acylphosphatase